MSDSQIKIDTIGTSLLPENYSNPSEITPSTLKSSKTYHCANHPDKEAFCLCVKCGDYLCKDCGCLINGRRYCDQCLAQDEQLLMAYQSELLRPRLIQAAMEIQQCQPPHRFSELPRALGNMLRQNTAFYVTAKDSSYALTFYLAAIALLPVTILQNLMYRDEKVAQISQIMNSSGYSATEVQTMTEQLTAMPDSTIVLIAILATLLNVLLVDLVYWICLRVFTPSPIRFTQAGAVINFCMLPLIFATFVVYYDLPAFFNFLPIALMIIQATTATRVSTQCTLFQGIGVMVTFIIIFTKLSFV